MSRDRTKYTLSMQNIIGKQQYEELITVLRKENFALMVYESTDRSTVKHLVLGVRQFIFFHGSGIKGLFTMYLCFWWSKNQSGVRKSNWNWNYFIWLIQVKSIAVLAISNQYLFYNKMITSMGVSRRKRTWLRLCDWKMTIFFEQTLFDIFNQALSGS